MSSPSQKHGSCGHIMASFDSHNFCARCREKGKGSDPCTSKNDCNSCNVLTEEQRLQLSTPSYRIKKEKRDLKKSSDTPKQDSSSSSLIDPSSVTVVGAVDGQGILQSPGSSAGKKKKSNSSDKPKVASKDSKANVEKPSKSSVKPHKSSVDSRIDDLDLKWSDRFNRIEALLLARSLEKPKPTFTSVKIAPAHSPPASSVISSKPFIRPSDAHRSPTSLHRNRLPTSQLDRTNYNNTQICMVLLRLPPSRPASR